FRRRAGQGAHTDKGAGPEFLRIKIGGYQEQPHGHVPGFRVAGLLGQLLGVVTISFRSVLGEIAQAIAVQLVDNPETFSAILLNAAGLDLPSGGFVFADPVCAIPGTLPTSSSKTATSPSSRNRILAMVAAWDSRTVSCNRAMVSLFCPGL